MLRFAAAPTADMHVGDLRIALFNYIVSKQRGEDLIVRIDDMDKKKNIENKDQEILDTLSLFGIEYSQVIHQSQNVRFHSAMALQLMHEKKAFSCFCSNEWLDKKRKEADEANKPYMYDDACRDLPHELVIDNMNPFSVRIKRPYKNISIADHINGELSFKEGTIESFVIMNQSKTPTSVFASTIDDMLSDISVVVQSKEDIEDAPKEAWIRESLSYDKKIEYAHLDNLEMDESISVKSLLEDGYLPSAISNYLISIGNEVPCEIFDMKDSIEWLDISKLSKSSEHFDIDALRDINKEHLRNLDSKELSRYVGFADSEIGELARVYLKDASTTRELKSKIEPIFVTKKIPAELSQDADIISKIIKNAPYFEEYDEFKKYIIKESNLDDENFSKAFRYMLTGTDDDGADIAEIYKHLKNYIGEIVK